jgi:hypothetical protein
MKPKPTIATRFRTFSFFAISLSSVFSVHFDRDLAEAGTKVVEVNVRWSASSDIGTLLSGIRFAIISAESRTPKGLSWWPGCQIETFSAFHVSTGPTVAARVGTMATLPPPEVRAFWMIVTGCRSTSRAESLRYSAGVGGAFLYAPSRLGGSLNAQCLVSP